jgi:hypothetical protein
LDGRAPAGLPDRAHLAQSDDLTQLALT